MVLKIKYMGHVGIIYGILTLGSVINGWNTALFDAFVIICLGFIILFSKQLIKMEEKD